MIFIDKLIQDLISLKIKKINKNKNKIKTKL